MGVIKRSLKYKFILAVGFICFICLSLFSVVSYNISYRAVLDQTTQKIMETTGKDSGIMNNWFNQQASIVQGVAEDFAALDITNRERVKAYLPIKKARYPYLTLLYVAYPDKELIADNWIPPKDFDPTGRVWYKGAMEKDTNYFSEPYLDANTGNMVIAVSKSFEQNGRLAGIVAADIDIGYVTKFVRGISISENSYAFLIDNQNNIVVHPNKDFQPTSNGLKKINGVLNEQLANISHIEENNNKIIRFKDYDGQEKYLSIHRIPANDWTLGIVVPENVFAKPLSNLLPGFIVSFLVSLVLGIAIILLLMNKMLKPVMNLTQVVKHFGDKKLDARCVVSSDDEIGELSSSFNNMADMIQDYSITLETKVEQRTKELVEKNAKLQDSIEYAKMIQETILPENEEISQIIKDYFVIWDPRDIVGGDFYWMKRFDDGFVIVVGDCTGHGVPGALMTMAVNSMLNHIVNDACHNDPASILQELNFHLNQSLCRSSEENNIQDGLDAGVIFVANDGKILFAGAQISVFVVKEDYTMEIKGSRHTIGCDIIKRTKTFENHDIKYEPGMSFYMATDGIKDQVGGENGLPFGKKRLFAVLKSIQNLTMEEQKNIVLSTYEDYLKGEARRDDITMLGFRI